MTGISESLNTWQKKKKSQNLATGLVCFYLKNNKTKHTQGTNTQHKENSTMTNQAGYQLARN